ncbi:hypothetical protein ENBRE01_0405 [Enteropsectra breve]|nr:hypothetical protein ENBRE01_0405 [Enteropsectra breve]
MIFSKLLRLALFPPDTQQPPARAPSSEVLNLRILYEGLLPLEALVFYMGIFSPSKREVESIIELVFKAKNILLSNKQSFSQLYNYSKYASSDPISSTVGIRNKLMERDESGIIKYYIQSNFAELAEHLEDSHNASEGPSNIELGEKKLKRVEKDEEYKAMILRLRDDIYYKRNILSKIAAERGEFYREYSDIDPNTVRKTLISISLGGVFFNPARLAAIVSRINLANKDTRVKEWVRKILAPVEELELKTQTKDFYEGKQILLDFIKKAMERKSGEFDDIYEIRSEILKRAYGHDAYDSDMQHILQDKENIEHLEYLNGLLSVVENIRNSKYLVKYSKDIRDKYVVYLLTGQDEDKIKLLAYFNK